MIRINLAAGQRKRGAPRSGGGARYRAAGLVAAAAALALTWAAWQVRALHTREQRVAGETAAVGRAHEELAPALAQLAALDARHADLTTRVDAAAAWRGRRQAVAGLLQRIGRGVPAGMQLTELRQQPGALELGGRATAVAVVSEFAASLELAEQVAPPVEIIDTRADGGDAVRFSLRARLAPPAP